MAKPPSKSPAPTTDAIPRSHRLVDILAVLAALCCIAVGYLSINALNPDGVSYLDLATAMQRGDWSRFVQGYWSPLFPLLAGAVGLLTGHRGADLVALSHILNTIAALIAVAIIWRWARSSTSLASVSAVGRAFFATLLICSAGLPRIEAVTPDVLLLLILIGLSYELIVHGGRRWLWVGALLGLAFLAKTSCWPWLLAAIPLRRWAAADSTSRRRVYLSTVVCLGVVLTWAVPMSIKYGHPTLGSSGTLNWSWYLDANSSRLPDSDVGTNSAYRDVGVGNGRLLSVATFEDAAYWTYQPWGDPTDWSTKVLSQTGHAPNAVELVLYWLRMAVRVFGLWLGPLVVAVLLPAVLLQYRPRMIGELITTQRDAFVVLLLGLVGILQFVAVHAEPRLIGPFAAMLALGTLQWCFAAPPEVPRPQSPAIRGGLAWLGLAAAVGFAVPRLVEGAQSAVRLRDVTAQLVEMRRRIALVSDASIPVAVVGPAAPVMASAFIANVHIAMQVTPRFAALVATLPAAEQQTMLLTLFRDKVPMVWRTTAEGGIEILVVPSSSAVQGR